MRVKIEIGGLMRKDGIVFDEKITIDQLDDILRYANAVASTSYVMNKAEEEDYYNNYISDL